MNRREPTALDAFYRSPARAPAATRRVEVQPQRDPFNTIEEARKSLGKNFNSALLAAWASWWLSEVERLSTEGTSFQRDRSEYLMRLSAFKELEDGLSALRQELEGRKIDPEPLVPFVRQLSRAWWDSIKPDQKQKSEKVVKDASNRLRREAQDFETKSVMRTEHRTTSWRELFNLPPQKLTSAVRASKRKDAANFQKQYFPSVRDEELQEPLRRELRAIWKAVFTEAKKGGNDRDDGRIELLMKRAKNHELWEG